jgi:cytidyltransferase-like protein
MKTYIEKVLNDPFYMETYKHLGKNALAPAGFLYDKNPTQKTLLEIEKENFFFSNLNINKIIKNIDILSLEKIQQIKNSKKLYVLLSTGSFNPIHEGHVKMLELAAKKLEENNKEVIGGFLSPSHDSYVFTKDERFQISASQRLLLCEKLINKHDLLATDKWEALENAYAINFTDVIVRLEWLLNLTLQEYLFSKFQTKVEIDVVYVFGSDNYTFMDTFISNGLCVCVPRKEEDIAKCDNKKLSLVHFNFNDVAKRILVSEVGKQVSSTQIRNKEIAISETIEKEWSLIEDNSLPYLIRDDASLSTEFLASKISGYESKIEILRSSLFKIFESYFKNVSILSIQEQTKSFKNPHNFPVVNLDTWTRLKGDNKLRVSRIFNVNDGQIYSSHLFFENKSQLEKIINSEFSDYLLVDDDIATGFTVNAIMKQLHPKKCIEAISLNLQKQFYDIVDARDFIFGSQYGGLMCLNPLNKKLMRVPYIYPFINLHSRAKIPFTSEIKFSREIVQINIDFYINTELLVKDMDIYFRNFCEYLNIPLEMPILTLLNKLCI